MKDERRSERPCPACGGRSYSWGRVQGQGFHFVAEDASIWRRFFGMGWKLPARRCDGCGLLQIFHEPDPDRLNKQSRGLAEVDFS